MGVDIQFCKPPFAPVLHPWSFPDHKTLDYESYQNWMSTPKSLPQPLTSNALYAPSVDSSNVSCAVYNSTSTSPSRQTQHKDAMSPGPSGHNSAASEAGSGTEYSPDSKPNKPDTNADYSNSSHHYHSASPPFMTHGFGNSLTSSTSQSSHQLPGYPYISGADYGTALFHSANMFKAATLARVTKKRSSTGT